MKKIDRRGDGKKRLKCSICSHKGHNKRYHSNHASQASYPTNEEDMNGPMEWEAARANVGQQFANSQPPIDGGLEQGVVRCFLSQPTEGARQTGFDGSTSFVPKQRTNFTRKGSIPQRRPRASGSSNSTATLSEAWNNLMTK